MQKYAQTRKRKSPIPAIVFLLVALLFYGLFVLQQITVPELEQIAQYKCRQLAFQAMNSGTSRALEENPQLYKSLYQVTWDDAQQLLLIQSDASAVNEAQNRLSTAVEEDLAVVLAHNVLEMPLGNFTGIPLLSECGPDFPIYIHSEGYVGSGVYPTLKAAGVNLVNVSVYVHFDVFVYSYLPGCYVEDNIENDVLLDQFIVPGQVPSWYSESEEARNE